MVTSRGVTESMTTAMADNRNRQMIKNSNEIKYNRVHKMDKIELIAKAIKIVIEYRQEITFLPDYWVHQVYPKSSA